MQAKDRSRFHLGWHLIWGMLIAFTIAFALLHGYSTRFEYLSYWEAVSRTITYVIPQWCLIIIPAGLIVSGLSFLLHLFIRHFRADRNASTIVLLVIVGFLVAFGLCIVFTFMPHLAFIAVPVLLECIVLTILDRIWDNQSKEKSKRKNDEA